MKAATVAEGGLTGTPTDTTVLRLELRLPRRCSLNSEGSAWQKWTWSRLGTTKGVLQFKPIKRWGTPETGRARHKYW